MNRVSVCNADVDDLVKGRGAEYIDASSLVLVFASSGYFESANCVRELLRAVVTATPLATMLEPEVNKGGMTVEQIEAQVRAMYEPCEKHGTQFANKLTMWGLDKEVRTKERPPRDKPSRHAPSEECRRVKATCLSHLPIHLPNPSCRYSNGDCRCRRPRC
jgi:hypothetical protein